SRAEERAALNTSATRSCSQVPTRRSSPASCTTARPPWAGSSSSSPTPGFRYVRRNALNCRNSRRAEMLRDSLDFAVEIAWRAGRAAMARYQTGTTVYDKSDATPVTEADRDAERTARELI